MNYTTYMKNVMNDFKAHLEKMPQGEIARTSHKIIIKTLEHLDDDELKLIYLKYVLLATYKKTKYGKQLLIIGVEKEIRKKLGLKTTDFQKFDYLTQKKFVEIHKSLVYENSEQKT